jgi:uncharacterized membrane protein
MNRKQKKTRSGLWLLLRRLVASCCLCVPLSFIFVSVSLGQTYTYTELLPPGCSSAQAASINVNGVVVGYGVDGTGAIKGFLYSNGTYTDVLPPGWSMSSATGINSGGMVVGHGIDAATGIHKGFTYSNGTYTDVLPPGWADASVTGTNSGGVVVGYGHPAQNLKTSEGFIYTYSNGTYTDVLPPNWSWAYAYSISDIGLVAGYGQDKGGTWKGFIYNSGTYIELLPPGWTKAYVLSINDSGVAVGVGTTSTGQQKGFIATPSSPPPLPAVQMAQLMDFFDAAVAAGTLGSPPNGMGPAQVKNLDNVLTSAAQSIVAGDDNSACHYLTDAYKKDTISGKHPDPVAVATAAELQQQIQGLMSSLACP